MSKTVNREMHDCKSGKIVMFEDGTYFNGVKSKYVRRTKNFKDAKVFGSLSERDERYLADKDYKIVQVTFYISIDF